MDDRPVKRARLQLSERRAWEILQQVSKPLFGKITLVSSREEASELATIHSYDWLELEVPSPSHLPRPHLLNTLAWVQQAGQACVVWHLISCCVGFSGAENPVFWKRVVDSLLEDPTTKWGATAPFRPTQAVDDAHRFFTDMGDAIFPRFRIKLETIDRYFRAESLMGHVNRHRHDEIKVGDVSVENGAEWIKKVVLAFAGRRNSGVPKHDVDEEGEEDDGQSDRETDLGNGERDVTEYGAALRSVVQELIPYVDEGRYYAKNSLHLGIVVTDFFPLDDVGFTLEELEDHLACEGDYNDDLVSTLKLLHDGHIVFPFARLNSIAFANPEPYHDDEELACLSEILRRSPVVIPEIDVSVTDMLSDDALSDFLNAALRFRGSEQADLRVLALSLEHAAPHQIEMIFSALPRANTFGSLTLRIHPQRYDGTTVLSDHAWAWLAYALFHPLAPESSWQTLDLDRIDPQNVASAPLASLQSARTAIHRELCGSSGVATIQKVTVRAGTSAYHAKSLRGRKRFTWDAPTELYAILKVGKTTASDLLNAVCVVIPGRGRAWVSKRNIAGIVDGGEMQSSSLTGLRLSAQDSDTRVSFPAFPALMGALQVLDVSAFGLMNFTHLHEIASTCPHLQQLSIKCESRQGSESHDPQLVEMESLRGLELVFRGGMEVSEIPWVRVLPQLHELRISVIDQPPEHNRQRVQRFVQACSSLKYFVWLNRYLSFKDAGRADPYGPRRDRSRELLAIAPTEERVMSADGDQGEVPGNTASSIISPVPREGCTIWVYDK